MYRGPVDSPLARPGWLPVAVTVPPSAEPVLLAEVKAQARVDGSDSDALINNYIVSARNFIEDHTGTRLMTQTVVMRCASFLDFAALPASPIQSISSITYLDATGVQQTLDPTIYEAVLVGLEPSVRLAFNKQWPAVRPVRDAITVTAIAGYAALPAAITHAMLLLISSWYDNRDAGGIPEGVISLLSNHRV